MAATAQNNNTNSTMHTRARRYDEQHNHADADLADHAVRTGTTDVYHGFKLTPHGDPPTSAGAADGIMPPPAASEPSRPGPGTRPPKASHVEDTTPES